MWGMVRRIALSTARIIGLCIAAGSGYTVVFVALMKLLWHKGYPPTSPLVFTAALAAAVISAWFADQKLPRLPPNLSQDADRI